MLSWRHLGALAGMMFWSFSTAAWSAEEPVASYRLADHGTFARLTIVLPRGVSGVASRDHDSEIVRFTRPVKVRATHSDRTAGVVGVEDAGQQVVIRLAPGALVQPRTRDARLILDIRPGPAGGGERPGPVEGVPVIPAKPEQAVLPGLPQAMMAVVDGAVTRPHGAVGRNPGPASSISRADPADARPVREAGNNDAALPSTGGLASSAASIFRSPIDQQVGLLLPLDRKTGAAALRRGRKLVVVFDQAKPVDMGAVAGDTRFGQATYTVLPSGACLSLDVPETANPTVRREADGWLVTLDRTGSPAAPIVPRARDRTIELAAVDPGHVVVLPDPDGGGNLLFGTVRHDAQRILFTRRSIDAALPETILGVVVERLSDVLDLRPDADGFLLSSMEGSLSPPVAGRMMFSHTLDLPPIGVTELRARYKSASAAAAAAPVAARRASRLDAAEAALALGFGREAGDLAAIADQDAPGATDARRSAFLQGVAAVLADAPDAASRLTEARVGNADDAVLWRALDVARHDPGNSDAAHRIAERLPLLQSYPEPLMGQVVGDAALSLVTGGNRAEAELVTTLPGRGKVGLAQAMLLDREGQDARALAAYDHLASDPAPLVEERSAVGGVALRLKRHELDPAKATERLQAQILNARMSGDELPVRMRVAELKAARHDWTGALADIRDIEAAFPAALAPAAVMAASLMTKAAQQPAEPDQSASDPIAQLSLLQNNLDLLAPGEEKTRVVLSLSSRLVALDLSDQAAAMLQTALAGVSSATDRARLGASLSQLKLDQNDAVGARNALDGTEAPALPTPLGTERTLLRAQADAMGGDADKALETLSSLHTADAEALRAAELGVKHDWAGQATALTTLIALRQPPQGRLDGEGEDLVLRLAGATARAGDQTGLRKLDQAFAPRFPDPDRLAMLQVLTSPGVTSTSDLSRSASDIGAGRSAISAMAAPLPTARH